MTLRGNHMTVPRWDARNWQADRRHAGEPRVARAPLRLKRKLLLGGLGTMVALAVVVSATQMVPDEQVAICHATGSAEQPFVFLTARKDGFEHGHHRHHEADFFPQDATRGCEGDEVPVPPAEGNGTEPAPGNQTDDGDADGSATDDGTDDGAGNATDDGSDGEDDTDGDQTDDGNATGDGSQDGNATGNQTPEPAPAGDASIRQSSVQDDFEVVLTLVVSSLGPGVAQDVSLEDTLPDVRRTWDLGGDDAASCVLDGRALACWFGDLAPGQVRSVELRAYTDRMPCGFALTNTARVSATDDLEARNDASSAGIAARAC